jgi:solute carrier family 25 carnitine/acylcarnitine transporter 20/29
MQTSNQYKGLADCFRQTIAKDGFTALYRGMSAPLIGVSPMFALSFVAYDFGVASVKAIKGNDKPLNMFDYTVAGAWSAVPTTIITTPMERLKVVMQTQDQNPNGKQYKGMFDAASHMIKEGGVKSLYRGTVATLARVRLV